MKKIYVVGLIVVLVIAVAGFGFMQKSNSDNNMNNNMMNNDEMMNDDEMMNNDDMMEDEMMNDGAMAPNFELMSLDGDTVSLASLHGEKVYVKFWASWCSICLAGMDELEELSQSEDITVYTIVAPGEKGEKYKDDFIEWFNGLEYEHIKVLFDEDGKIQDAFGVRGFPSSAYIGSDGVLVKFMPGHVGNDNILAAFESIK